MTIENIHFHWTQPSALERHFELHSKNDVFGVLHFEKAQTAYGSLINEDLETERWTFEATGSLLKSRLTIRKTGADEDLAVYCPQFWGGGWVEFVKGSRFHWRSVSFWGREWGFFNAREELLYSLKQNFFDLLKIQAAVEIGAQWRDLDELPLLLMLGWYLKVCDSYAAR